MSQVQANAAAIAALQSLVQADVAAIAALQSQVQADAADIAALQAEMAMAKKEENTFYVFFAACLVFLMQCGFATLEAGSVRDKNGGKPVV